MKQYNFFIIWIDKPKKMRALDDNEGNTFKFDLNFSE